jgi:non-specific serine/threonine protein kinase
MYDSAKKDPILLRLNPKTVSTLQNDGINCIEDLFGLSEYDILNIRGIGKKRGRDIMNLLKQLPFNHMDESLSTNPQQDPHAGIDSELSCLLTSYDYRTQAYYDRGLDYFHRNKVQEIKLQDETSQIYEIAVRGTNLYTVTLKLGEKAAAQTHCTCPAFSRSSYGPNNCKHVYAAALALPEQQRLMIFEKAGDENYAYKQLVRRFKAAKSNSAAADNRPLEYFLVQKNKQWDLYPKRIYPFLQASSRYSYSFNNPWNDLAPSNPKDRLIVSYLNQIYSSNGYGYNSNETDKSFGDVLELLRDRPVYIKEDKTRAREIHFNENSFSLMLEINRAGDASSTDNNTSEIDLSLNFVLQNGGIKRNTNEVEVVCLDPCWVFDGAYLMEIKGSDLARKFFLNTPKKSIRVPAAEIESFLQNFYPTLQQAEIPMRIDEELTSQKERKPVPRLYLRENARHLEVQLRIAYDDYEVPWHDQRGAFLLPAQQDKAANGRLLWSVHRDMEQEEHWMDELLESGLENNSEFHTFTPEESSLEWVIDALPKLAEAGYEIYGEQQLKRYARPKKLTSSSFSIKSNEQWFELEGEMTFGDVTINMNDIRSVLVRDQLFIQLQDGSTGKLTENWLGRIKKLMHLMSNEQQNRLPKMAAPAIEEIGEAADEYTPDYNFEDYAGRLREFENIEQIDAPKKFKGELRSYQLAGLSWMYFLHQYDFGGILADDMGLGKTVQVLALMQKIYEESGARPNALVVAPRSVLHNWKAEADKFTPEYSVYIHHGADRIGDEEEWPDAPLVITTYGTMRNDIKQLSEKPFDYIILDESHTVRNPSSKTSRAVRKLDGGHRLCLTGTPVQNTTMDLWAQFEFINPGLLGGQKRFRDRWVKPLEENNDHTAEEMLHKMVAPFILRRTKQKVAHDLPPLTSSRVDCSMEATQLQVYEKYRQTYYQIVNKAFDEKGVRDSRFTVLEGLMRLRQICCSPRLIEGESGTSAKLDRFTELAEELIQEGHRALVFSQFVTFLHQIEAEVKARGWQYEYLDRQTRNRQDGWNVFSLILQKTCSLSA